MRRVCVFCGSSQGARPQYQDAARQLAREIAARNLGLVFGGGAVGLMGIVADEAIAAGAHVIGVIPKALVSREIAHAGLPDLRVVATMHERKAMMAGLSDAFVAAPGGFGTFEELCEAVTWSQLGIHQKPVGLLNVAGFYDPLLALFDRAVDEGFIRPANRQLVVSEENPSRLLDRLLVPASAPGPGLIAVPDET